jgi:hypothetical protein
MNSWHAMELLQLHRRRVGAVRLSLVVKVWLSQAQKLTPFMSD